MSDGSVSSAGSNFHPSVPNAIEPLSSSCWMMITAAPARRARRDTWLIRSMTRLLSKTSYSPEERARWTSMMSNAVVIMSHRHFLQDIGNGTGRNENRRLERCLVHRQQTED